MNLSKVFLTATAGVTVGIAMFQATPTQAATVAYDFEVSLTSGLLAGQTFNGSLSYDDSTQIGGNQGFSEFFGLSEDLSISFNFFNDVFTEMDDVDFDDPNATAFFPFIEVVDGDLVSLDYRVEVDALRSFTFASDVLGVPFFQYFDVNNDIGNGTPTFSRRSVPEPATALGLGAVGLSLLLLKKVKSSRAA